MSLIDELKAKLEKAEEGKIEAFWSVDIQRDADGGAYATLTAVVDAPSTEVQRGEFIWRDNDRHRTAGKSDGRDGAIAVLCPNQSKSLQT